MIIWRTMVLYGVSLLIPIFGAANAAEWQTSQTYDDIADKTRKMAFVALDDGHSFGLYQEEGDEGVWIMIAIPADSKQKLANSQFPIIRVDKRDPIDTADLVMLEEMGGPRQYHFSPNTFYSYFPSTVEVANGIHFVYDLMVGSVVKARYWRTDGAAVRVEFPLSGSRQAIASVIGAHDLPTPEQARLSEKTQDNVGKSMLSCARKHSPYLEGVENPNQASLELCLETTTACGEITATHPDKFNTCFTRHVEIYHFCANYSESKNNAPGWVESCLELKLNQAFPNHQPYSIELR